MILNHAPFALEGRRVLLLAEGEFSPLGSKTAVCYLRYRQDDVAAVLDSTRCGQSTQQAAGVGGDTPIVSSVDEALAFGPEVAIVGVAPRGGQLDPELRQTITKCFAVGLDVVSGLHSLIGDDPELAAAASDSGARFWDVRYVPATGTVASGAGCATGAKTVLVTGTDCNVGKMTVTVDLYNEAVRRGMSAAWAATGQTGIMLRGRGVCVDRVIADFIGGAAEELVNFEGREKDVVFVEGQGALLHPGYAGVTLGLMFGVMPDCMILAHDVARDRIRRYEVPMPGIADMIALHESVMEPLKKVPVVAVALNTAELTPEAATRSVSDLSRQTGLPVSDSVRFGASELLDAVMRFLP
ncbi:MAG: DUF1611 domain-containing protein [Candidatus Latescibacterota bacterium]|nr:MAG: DUF1611 domain-containing protein [Candidatus Latescibacterota bacterium]